MEVLKQILWWAIPIIASCVLTTILAFIIKRNLTNYFNKVDEEKKKKEEDEKALEAFKEEEKKKLLAENIERAVDKATQPILTKIDNIDNKLDMDRKATVTLLRSKLKTLRDQYKTQGYADDGDKATWEELYNDYADMGGNHFKQWVDLWRVQVRDLPEEKPKAKRSTTTTKKTTTKK